MKILAPSTSVLEILKEALSHFSVLINNMASLATPH